MRASEQHRYSLVIDADRGIPMNEDQSQGTMLCRNANTNATTSDNLSFQQEEWFDRLPLLSEEFLQRYHRPLVTVSYAQSVDGSIAARNRQQLRLSSHQSMVLTHRIRAASDAVIIGINTLLVDDPRLTVRHIEGKSPQPIVLDSNLRFPERSRLLERTDHRCWLACTDKNDPGRVDKVKKQGVKVIRCQGDNSGKVDLPNLLHLLGQRGIRSIMVEGGSQVITSFIETRLVDKLIVTITPNLVGGLAVLGRPAACNGSLLRLNQVTYQSCGPDLILWAQPQWQEI
jgi:riboflavin-specific deaminase-like protein